MKLQADVVRRLDDLTKEYERSNSFGQAVIGQLIAQLCWVLDMDYDEYSEKNLKRFDKSRYPLR